MLGLSTFDVVFCNKFNFINIKVVLYLVLQAVNATVENVSDLK